MTESDEQAQVADSDDAVDESPTAQREESLQDAPDRVEVDPPEDESSDSSTTGG